MSDLNFVAIKGIVKNIERDEDGYRVTLLNKQVNEFNEDDSVYERHIIYCSYDKPFTEMIMKTNGKTVIVIGELCFEDENYTKPIICADVIIENMFTNYGKFSGDMEKNISTVVNLLSNEFPRYC